MFKPNNDKCKQTRSSPVRHFCLNFTSNNRSGSKWSSSVWNVHQTWVTWKEGVFLKRTEERTNIYYVKLGLHTKPFLFSKRVPRNVFFVTNSIINPISPLHMQNVKLCLSYSWLRAESVGFGQKMWTEVWWIKVDPAVLLRAPIKRLAEWYVWPETSASEADSAPLSVICMFSSAAGMAKCVTLQRKKRLHSCVSALRNAGFEVCWQCFET